MAQSPTSLPSQPSGWKQIYECAILELDNTRLPLRIAEARRTILNRAEELLTHPSSDERAALNHALRKLLEEVAVREKRAA